VRVITWLAALNDEPGWRVKPSASVGHLRDPSHHGAIFQPVALRRSPPDHWIPI